MAPLTDLEREVGNASITTFFLLLFPPCCGSVRLLCLSSTSSHHNHYHYPQRATSNEEKLLESQQTKRFGNPRPAGSRLKREGKGTGQEQQHYVHKYQHLHGCGSFATTSLPLLDLFPPQQLPQLRMGNRQSACASQGRRPQTERQKQSKNG